MAQELSAQSFLPFSSLEPLSSLPFCNFSSVFITFHHSRLHISSRFPPYRTPFLPPFCTFSSAARSESEDCQKVPEISPSVANLKMGKLSVQPPCGREAEEKSSKGSLGRTEFALFCLSAVSKYIEGEKFDIKRIIIVMVKTMISERLRWRLRKSSWSPLLARFSNKSLLPTHHIFVPCIV